MKKFTKFAIIALTFMGLVIISNAQPLSGTYTVNPAGASTGTNFKNIVSALAYLQGGSRTDAGPNNAGPFGVSDAVIFNIYPGTYVESLALTGVPGTSTLKTLTFKSFNNDSLNTKLSGLSIANVSHVIIKKLWFNNNANFTGTTGNISLENNTLQSVIYNGNSNFSVINNQINAGLQLGYTSTSYINNVIIKNNTIVGVNSDGNGSPYIVQWYRVAKPVFDNNKILDISLNYYASYLGRFYKGALYFRSCSDTAFITNNQFLRIGINRLICDEVAGSGDLQRLAHVEMTNNFITAKSLFTLTLPAQYNNTTTYLGEPASINYSFNNYSSISTNSGINSVFSTGTSLFTNFKNNNFYGKASGLLVQHAVGGTANANYNNYKNNGGVLIATNTTYNSLAAYQTAGLEANSISVNPKYINDTNNLHARHPLLIAAGTPTPTINPLLYDIDNDNRNSITPCIGADEFMVNSNDVVLDTIDVAKKDFAAAAPNSIKVKFTNKGAATLNQVQINYSINGVAQAPFAWAGSLAYDSSTAFVTIGSPIFNMLKVSTLKVWTSMPNAAPDQNPIDDSLNVNNIIPYTRGVFTLGGATPTFTNFNHLDSVLKLSGVDSAVIINIRNGRYYEQATFTKVRNASLTNLITIKGENNNAALDTIAFLPPIYATTYNAATFTYNDNKYGTAILDSTQFTVFKHITFQDRNITNTNTSAISSRGNCNALTFDSCTFTRITITSSTPVYSLFVNQNTGVLNNLKVLNSTFNNGAGGLYVFASNVVVKGNSFKNLSGNQSIFIRDEKPTNFVTIDSNFIIGNDRTCAYLFGNVCYLFTLPTIGGITYENPLPNNNVAVNISRNYVNLFGGNKGISVAGGNAANPVKVFNNMVSNYSATGIEANGSFIEIMHNSVADSNATYGLALVTTGSNIKVNNNIFVKGLKENAIAANSGLVAIARTPAQIATSNLDFDNNAFFAPDTSKIFNIANSSVFYNLSQWQTLYNKDLNSKRIGGNLFNNIKTDLHINKNFSGAVDVYNNGTPITYVPKDIDDSLRSIATPSIGADEFTLNNTDGGATNITKNGGGLTFLGANNFDVNLKNYGVNNITSATINWSVNGVIQTPANFMGSLATGQVSSLSLGSFTFTTIGAHVIKAWSAIGSDNNTLNDTTTIIIRPALCGTYTIGGASPTFNTLDSSITYMNLAGVGCAVVFNMRNGIFNAATTIGTFIIKEVVGASALNTITFQSESGDSNLVKISNTSSYSTASVIQLKGADFIRFQKISIEGLFSGIIIADSANFNIITNCVLKAGGGKGIEITGLYAGGLVRDTNNIIANNYFTATTKGIVVNGAKNITIHNNKFINIQGSPNTYGTDYAIEINYGSPNVVITNNLIDTVTGNTNIYSGGINLYSGTYKATITGNDIRLRKGLQGINFYYAGGLNAANPMLIANNFIATNSATVNSGAIYGNTAGAVIVANNNILNASTTPGVFGMLLQSNSTTFKDTIRNNNIIATNNDYAYLTSLNNTVFSSHNNIRANGLFKAYYGNTLYTTIASYQTASGINASTVSINPLYTSLYNLHIAENTLNTAATLSYIPTDIDGDIKSTTAPFIGADELILNSNDAGVTLFNAPAKPFAAGNQSVQVTIRNFGTTTLTNATVNWSVNGVMQTPFSYTGSLGFNASGMATIGNYNFAINNPYNIKVWTSSPNGNTDGNLTNDTTIVTNYYPALAGTYTIGGVTPDFGTFNLAKNNLAGGGVLGNVLFNIRDGVYNETLVLDSIPFQNNNTITWQGQSLDSSKVALRYKGVYLDNKSTILTFTNAKNQIVKNITLKLVNDENATISSSTTLRNLVNFNTKNRNLQLLNNLFIDSTFNAYPNSNSNVSFIKNTPSSADTLITINNNRFLQLLPSNSSAVEMRGVGYYDYASNYISQKRLNKFTFNSNIFNTSSNNKYALFVFDADSATITNNKIEGAVYVNATENILIDKNTIYHEGYNSSALDINAGIGRAAGKPAIITNNIVQTKIVLPNNTTSGSNIAVSLYGDRIYFAHNTANTLDSAGIVLSMSGSRDTIINNILFNNQNGSLYSGLPTNAILNNNLLFGTRISANIYNITQWRTFSNQDANSITGINPYFRGVKDLHASNILIKTLASIPKVATDIDGQPRSATTCYGADEFTQPVNDAVITDYTPRKIFPDGNNNIAVTIYNNGSAPITSLQFLVDLQNFPYSGLPTVAGNFNYNFAGNIASGASQTITLGSLNIPMNRNQLKINNLLTNGVADDVPHTDTLQNDLFYAGLNGIYTASNAVSYYGNNQLATFNTFPQLNNQLKYGGVYGPSTVNLLPGMHYGFNIDSVPNRGSLSPLLITSADADSLNTGLVSSSTYSLYLNNASYVTFKKMMFQLLGGSSYYYHNLMVLKSNNINIENCNFKTNNAAGTDYLSGANIGLVSSNNCIIKNNYFDTSVLGVSIVSNFNDSSRTNQISNNIFNNQGVAGIYASANVGLIINKNLINSTSTNTIYKGIFFSGFHGKLKVTNNKIYHSNDGAGIVLDGNTTWYYNDYLDSLHITNNFITVGNNGAAVGLSVINGNANYVNRCFVYHNSINNLSSNANAIAFNAGSSHLKVLNNIFYNKLNGKAINVSKSGTYFQNYNLLKTGGSILGTVNGTNYATLSALAAGGSVDYNSVTGDPLFVSDTDLHADGAIVNNTASFEGPTVTPTDIDSDPRNTTTPDIGADEFTLPNYGIVQLESPLSSCQHTATEPIKAWVKNFGTTTRNRIPVAYRINGGAIVRDTANIILNGGDSALYTFTQTANMVAAINYNVQIWTAYRGDSLPTNDTLKILVATTSANNMLPYYTGFEGNPNGWYTAGQNSTWAWGVIYSGVIDSAANGLNAWKTNLTGPHRNGELSYLYSPCFNLSALTTNPILNFNYTHQIENINDKVWVELSADAGATWSKLGIQGSGLNWYNTPGNYWSGVKIGWSNGKYELPITTLSDKSKVRLRFVMQTNSSIVADGFAIDDLSIYTTANPPVSSGTYLNRMATSTGTATFIPVNDPSGNRLIEINDNGNTLGNITVDVNVNTSAAPTVFNGQYFLGRNFVIRVQNQPTTPVRVRLFITQAEFNALQAANPAIDQVRSLGVYQYSNSILEDFSLINNIGPTAINIMPAQITKIPYLDGYYLEFSISSFSEFWVGSTGATIPLSQPQTMFTAQKINSNTVAIKFTTLLENNVDHYQIQRSINGLNFTTIAQQVPVNNNATQFYTYTDANVPTQTQKLFYRLKKYERGGQIVYSNVIIINLNNDFTISLYPNPVLNMLNITCNNAIKTIKIFNSLGQTVAQFTQAPNNQYNVTNLTQGMYKVQILTATNTYTQTIIKQ